VATPIDFHFRFAGTPGTRRVRRSRVDRLPQLERWLANGGF
jgi:hypothetical protein